MKRLPRHSSLGPPWQTKWGPWSEVELRDVGVPPVGSLVLIATEGNRRKWEKLAVALVIADDKRGWDRVWVLTEHGEMWKITWVSSEYVNSFFGLHDTVLFFPDD